MHELMEVYIKGMSERSELIPCMILLYYYTVVIFCYAYIIKLIHIDTTGQHFFNFIDLTCNTCM